MFRNTERAARGRRWELVLRTILMAGPVSGGGSNNGGPGGRPNGGPSGGAAGPGNGGKHSPISLLTMVIKCLMEQFLVRTSAHIVLELFH